MQDWLPAEELGSGLVNTIKFTIAADRGRLWSGPDAVFIYYVYTAYTQVEHVYCNKPGGSVYSERSLVCVCVCMCV